MEARGDLGIDPGVLEPRGDTTELEIVVLYTEWEVTRAVVDRVVALTAGLNARVSLVAVHTVPYPLPFGCPATVHAHLVEQLVDLASLCPLPANSQVVLARSRGEGFRHVLKPASTVLIGSRTRWWRTSEEPLARLLAWEGHKVALVHVS